MAMNLWYLNNTLLSIIFAVTVFKQMDCIFHIFIVFIEIVLPFCLVINVLKIKCNLLYIRISPYHTVNTFHHGYKNQSVNAV